MQVSGPKDYRPHQHASNQISLHSFSPLPFKYHLFPTITVPEKEPALSIPSISPHFHTFLSPSLSIPFYNRSLSGSINIPLTHSFPTHLSFTSHSTVFHNFPYFLKTILTAYSYSPLLTPYLYLSFFYYTSLSHSYPSPSPTLLSPTNPVHFRYSLQQADLTFSNTLST